MKKRHIVTGDKVLVSIPLHAYITFEGVINVSNDGIGDIYTVSIDKVIEQSKQWKEGDSLRVSRRMLLINSKPVT